MKRRTHHKPVIADDRLTVARWYVPALAIWGSALTGASLGSRGHGLVELLRIGIADRPAAGGAMLAVLIAPALLLPFAVRRAIDAAERAR